MHRQLLGALVTFSLLLSPAFCGASRAAESTPATDAAAPSKPADAGYRLGTGDQLRITVYNETDLSGDYNVDDGGFVRLPLIGQIKAAGSTLVELEKAIEDKFAAGYLRSPRVNAEVTNYRPFYIIGEVNKPGQYPYVNGMNIVTAVALAGGYTYRADDSSVYIRRNGGSQEESDPADETTKIQPGDIIRVAERFF